MRAHVAPQPFLAAVPVNDRWCAVPDEARAIALDIETEAGRLVKALGGRTTTPHGMASGRRSLADLRKLLG